MKIISMQGSDLYRIILSTNYYEKNRLETFFDAVYAIVMTILVLGLTLPVSAINLSSGEIIHLMFPQLLHFAIAFFILGAFWGAHHRLFFLVKKIDSVLIKLTFLILFITCLLPFTSSLAGDYHTLSSSVLLFHLNMLILGTLFAIQWIYLVKADLTDNIPGDLFRYVLFRSLMVPIVAAIALIVVIISPPWSSASYMLLILLQIMFLPFKPKNPIKHGLTDNSKSLEETIILSKENRSIRDSLDRVSDEMGISRERLIEKILKQWDHQNQVATGKERSLCNLSIPDSFRDSDSDKTDIK